jgi:hypothetical protein
MYKPVFIRDTEPKKPNIGVVDIQGDSLKM